MAFVNPLYSALASRLPRRRFIPIAYHAFAAMLAVFAALYAHLPGCGGLRRMEASPELMARLTMRGWMELVLRPLGG